MKAFFKRLFTIKITVGKTQTKYISQSLDSAVHQELLRDFKQAKGA